jgi:hypothetical protein
VLLTHRLEAVNLERNHDEIFAAAAGFRTQLRGAVGKALAVRKAGDWIGAGEQRRPFFLFGAHFGFVLKVDIAPPSEQDQRDIQGQRSAGDANIDPELVVFDPDVAEEGAAVPDQEQNSGDQHREHDGITPCVEQSRKLGPRAAAGHELSIAPERLINSSS